MRFISCPSCACLTKSGESRCIECGGLLRNADGIVPRTGAALLLGLSTISSACGANVVFVDDGEEGGGGASNTSSSVSTTSTGGGTTVFSDGGRAEGGVGEGGIGPVYGVAQTGGGGSGGGDDDGEL